MKRAINVCISFCLPLLFTTGCWNLKEPDQLAFITGNGLDLTDDEKLEASVLIVIPAGIGGGKLGGGENKESFQVLSATGKNVSDALVNIQKKVSRTLFPGHRDIFLVGNRLAEQGFGETIDPFIRNAQSDLRALIYVVKDGKPKEVFSINPFLDSFISSSLSDSPGAIGLRPYRALEFVVDVLSDSKQPLLPVVSLNPSKQYSYIGTAIFNKDDNVKLVEFLDTKESNYAYWITDRLLSQTITTYVPKGKGNVSVTLDRLSKNVKVKVVDEKIKIDVLLTGKGTIIENNTDLDPSNRKDLLTIQREINRRNQKSAQQLVNKVKDVYKMDIFGFGENVHHQHPQKWQSLKRNWSKIFPNTDVSIKVDVQCEDPGQTSTSIN